MGLATGKTRAATTPRVAYFGFLRDKLNFASDTAKGVGPKTLPDDNLTPFSFTLPLGNLRLLFELIMGAGSLENDQTLGPRSMQDYSITSCR